MVQWPMCSPDTDFEFVTKAIQLSLFSLSLFLYVVLFSSFLQCAANERVSRGCVMNHYEGIKFSTKCVYFCVCQHPWLGLVSSLGVIFYIQLLFFCHYQYKVAMCICCKHPHRMTCFFCSLILAVQAESELIQHSLVEQDVIWVCYMFTRNHKTLMSVCCSER